MKESEKGMRRNVPRSSPLTTSPSGNHGEEGFSSFGIGEREAGQPAQRAAVFGVEEGQSREGGNFFSRRRIEGARAAKSQPGNWSYLMATHEVTRAEMPGFIKRLFPQGCGREMMPGEKL